MPEDRYPALALSTASADLFPERVSTPELVRTITKAVLAAEALDRYKRLLYYAVPRRHPDAGEALFGFPSLSREQTDRLHAALGLVTEAGEVLDAVATEVFGGGPLDRTNATEEAGDVRWYLALYERSLGLSREGVEQANLRKLALRNGGTTFNAERNAERDTAAERAALDASAP